MPSPTDFPARGKVTAVKDGRVIFQPSNTNYELHLDAPGGKYAGPLNSLIDCLIRCDARKVWTVPSGGNFITPLFGPPRIIQGRVKYLDETTLVVQAGAPIIVSLPADEEKYELARGPVTLGGLVNITTLPGARFELVGEAVPR